jgi:hypothetical protein
MKFRCWDGVIGQHRNAASTSSVAASERSGALTTMSLTSLKVPQSHLKSSMLIWSLIDERVGSFLGKDRSCTIRRSVELGDFGTVPSGEDRNGPIRASSSVRVKGPEYRPKESSFWI